LHQAAYVQPAEMFQQTDAGKEHRRSAGNEFWIYGPRFRVFFVFV
jgi:hypothetical protein